MAELSDYQNEILRGWEQRLKEVKEDPINFLFIAFAGIGLLSIIAQLDIAKISSYIPWASGLLTYTVGFIQRILLAANLIGKLMMIFLLVYILLLIIQAAKYKINKFWVLIGYVLLVVMVILFIMQLPTLLPGLYPSPAFSIIFGGP